MVLPVIKQTILIFFSEILNLAGHVNCCISSKVTTILLNGWIFPTGEVASGRVCPAACAAALFISRCSFQVQYEAHAQVLVAVGKELLLDAFREFVRIDPDAAAAAEGKTGADYSHASTLITRHSVFKACISLYLYLAT